MNIPITNIKNTNMSSNERTTKIRDFKVKFLLGELEMPIININNIKKKNLLQYSDMWKYILKYKDLGLITGSVALKAYGLIERTSHDIDIITTEEILNKYLKANNVTIHEHNSYTTEGITNSLGFIDDNGYQIDFFISDGNESFTTDNNIRFHNPLEIVEKKLAMKNRGYKDNTDIDQIIYKLNNIN